MRWPKRWGPDDPGEWFAALQAASLGFLFLLAIGSVLAVVVKLQYPNFGSGADPIQVFTSVVIFSLACLRTPIHIGDLTLTIVPLGALAAALVGIAWATRAARASKAEAGRWRTALRIGVAFGGLCFAAALVFRFRSDVDPIHAGALGAFVWGVVWGTAGSALGTTDLTLTPPALARSWTRAVAEPKMPVALRATIAIAGTAIVIGLAVVLMWTIGRLAADGLPRRFGVADSIAAVAYLVAFAPNLAVAVVGLSVGASIEAGTQLTMGGRLVGPSKDLSMFDWGGGTAPPYVFLLLVIPVLLGAIGGYIAARGSGGRRALVVSAAALAVGVGALSWLGEARLGAALAGSRGFGRLSINPIEIAVFMFAWVVVVGLIAHQIFQRRFAGGA